jgi:predicted HTH transcriptional regulator
VYPEKFIATEKMSSVVLNDVINVVLNKAEQAAVAIIKESPLTTAEQLAARLSKSTRTAQRYLDSLQKKNIIRRVGAKKDGRWELVRGDES